MGNRCVTSDCVTELNVRLLMLCAHMAIICNGEDVARKGSSQNTRKGCQEVSRGYDVA